MSNLVIVAIPAEDDYVWQISSEKVPHLTICFLGEVLKNTNVTQIQNFLEHAAATSLTPFYLEVDYRGTLGVDLADVIFFDKIWDFKLIETFRNQLLLNDSIRAAYESVTQFPEWNPHLTLGYPKTPAKKDTRDYPGIRTVRFDRVALWTGDFSGPEFRLKHNFDMEVSMSDASTKVEEIISHHGIKGMRWGHRTASAHTPATPHQSVSLSGKVQAKAAGGTGHTPHSDAVNAAVAKQILKKSGTDALSNKELRDLSDRMNLEQQTKRLLAQDKTPGRKLVEDQLKTVGKQELGKAISKKVAAVGA